jgi:carbonic anhydrase
MNRLDAAKKETPLIKPSSKHVFSRRGLLKSGLTGAIGASLLGGMEFTFLEPIHAQSTISPDAAMAELMTGNKRFISGHITSQEQDLAALRQKTVDKQQPFAAVLSCADSRVPVEIIFDETIGQIFVTRVAGNIATPEIIGSLEYGAAELGTKVILVMGHSGCGAVKATMEGKPVPGQISSLFPHIESAVRQAGPNLEATIKANAKIQASLLRDSSTVISQLLKENRLKVVAAYYNLGTGTVEVLT